MVYIIKKEVSYVGESFWHVKWFNDGWFIGYGRGDVFVHHSAIQAEGFKSLKEGQSVTMEVTQGQKALRLRT